MKGKKKFWLIGAAILVLAAVIWVIFLRPDRPVVPVSDRLVAGEDGTRTLIVVYSYSGNTQRVAETLQEQTGGDLLRINTRRDYLGGMAAMAVQTRLERATGLLPALDVELPDLERYDTILIGGPVWSYTVATPLSRFLSQMDFTGKTVAPFWTDAGSPGDYEEDFNAQIKGTQPSDGLGLSGASRLSDDELHQRLAQWLTDISIIP